MKPRPSYLFTLLLPVLPASSGAAAELDHIVQDYLSRTFSTAVLLTNGDAVRVGFWDFDPNEFLDLDNDDLGNPEATRLRQSIHTAALPWSWPIPMPSPQHKLQLQGKLSYLAVESEGQFVPSESPLLDKVEDSVVSADIGVSWRYPLTTSAQLTVRQTLHWMHYENDTQFRSEQSKTLQPSLDGLLTNMEVDALMLEPSVMLSYDLTPGETLWHLFSDYHYMVGDTYNTGRNAHDATPEAWFWSNGARMKSPLISQLLPGQNIWFRAARVDMGADLNGALGNHHYYEAGLAWLVDTGSHIPLLDNIGIGLNFNYGSVLRGGTLVLMLNEH